MPDEAAQPAASRRQSLGVLVLILTASMWSLNGPLIKLLSAGGAGLDGVTIACFRSLLGGLLFLPFAFRRRETLGHVPGRWLVATVATFTLMTAAFVIATTRTAAANAIVLQYIAPLVVFALAPVLLKERPRAVDAAALSVAMAGVLIIFALSPATDMGGLSIALLSGVGYGLLMLMLRLVRRVDPTAVVCLNTLGSGLLLLPAVGLFGTFSLSAWQWAVLAGMSVVQFALPYVFFSWAIRYVEAPKASLITLLETVLNPLWTFLFVQEVPPRATLLGGPVILAGVAGWMLLQWRRPQPRPA